jgi:hypothetical protein
MPEKRVINRIHRVQSADTQAVELLREANKQASKQAKCSETARARTHFWAARPMSRSRKMRTVRSTSRLNRVAGFSCSAS